ncbi:MAG TPA: hypothetical protein VD971_08835 [Phycisphaerales bacterium]|nr:hypothetical protein [Phycisphaerales bacterium]
MMDREREFGRGVTPAMRFLDLSRFEAPDPQPRRAPPPRVADDAITVVCVEQSAEIAAALRSAVSRTPGVAWMGWLRDARDLTATVARTRPRIVLLDADAPGHAVYMNAAEVAELFPECRLIFVGVGASPCVIGRALDAGAWAYVARSDGMDALLDAVRDVAAGQFVLSPSAGAVYRSA